ncbi:MAG: tRNA (adenosine(37)-N6)-threonylcarbamoyltransferase complex ATPase subunit type 1 TsaE [Peptoniphilaceae bacterium]|nr:tRNA (adenosine(37)-N6)-threonylcarbamoyltransferase complex ATPase subunit type 1 TsaE [Peptoniphilaceae bacterium]MDD7383196.1 tRNA (adenosine(37)-N6)-threonylcarbamoyltransferase complex ATPase subunit type 1 TsaE [Peptoniphilaceae bacterium]MDY3738420.1 tRNA (adenosine(37)-N6)-threonylcarbamoyltransferase complex ATPase subunit type 1 TsaE [Peptoniphilaceae bacterium]
MIINNLEELDLYARKFSENIHPGDVINLIGDLGSGKTTFVQKIAKYLGVTSNVLSPSFSIVNIYDGKFRIYHLDLYRFESEEEIYDIDFETYLYPKEAVTFIEWSNRAESFMPDNMINVKIEKISDTKRNFEVEK